MRHLRWIVPVLLVLVLVTYCSGPKVKQSDFVGKWKSTRLVTPLYMYGNGEWEIKKDDGTILQYGVWRYEDKKIIWTVKLDSYIHHDVNPLLSFAPREFKLREADGATTMFSKLD